MEFRTYSSPDSFLECKKKMSFTLKILTGLFLREIASSFSIVGELNP